MEDIQKSRERGTYFVRTESGSTQTWVIGDRYTLLKVLGEGSFSQVVLAQDNSSGEKVALKRIGDVLNSIDNAKRVLREVCIMRRLRHNNIIRLLDVFLQPSATGRFVYRGGRLVPTSVDIYLALEYCNQGDLFHMRGQMSESEVRAIMWQLLSVIKYMHSTNVWHRDLKSANILVTLEGGRRAARLCDFGSARSGSSDKGPGTEPSSSNPPVVACILSPAGGGSPAAAPWGGEPARQSKGESSPSGASFSDLLVRPSARGRGFEMPLTRVVCTPCYRAPEVVMSRGNYTSALDLWSLGCVFGELLQRVPYLGKSSTPHLQVAPLIAINGMPKTPAEGETFEGPGSTITRQELDALFSVIGTPCWGAIEAMPMSREWRSYLRHIPSRAPALFRRMGSAGEVALDLLQLHAPAPALFRRIGSAGEVALDLLQRLLQFDPSRRASAAEAQTHEYFEEMRDEEEDEDESEEDLMSEDLDRAQAAGGCGGGAGPATAAAMDLDTPGALLQPGAAAAPHAAVAASGAATGFGAAVPVQRPRPKPGQPFYELEDPSQALAALEAELVAITDAGGCDRLRDMLERECEEHAAQARQLTLERQRSGSAEPACFADAAAAAAAGSTPARYSTRGPSGGGGGGGGVGGTGSAQHRPRGQHRQAQVWEKLVEDPGRVMDPSAIGMERIPHHADSEQATLDPNKHLRAGRHGEWTPSSLAATSGSGAKAPGGTWGVSLVPPGMDPDSLDPGLMEAIRQQHAR